MLSSIIERKHKCLYFSKWTSILLKIMIFSSLHSDTSAHIQIFVCVYVLTWVLNMNRHTRRRAPLTTIYIYTNKNKNNKTLVSKGVFSKRKKGWSPSTRITTIWINKIWLLPQWQHKRTVVEWGTKFRRGGGGETKDRMTTQKRHVYVFFFFLLFWHDISTM